MMGDTMHAAAPLDKCFRAHLLDAVQAGLEFLLASYGVWVFVALAPAGQTSARLDGAG